ncbi:hypothetical protein [Pseudomonas monteilii]|uniref:hypothetical protein n=1 Tax=Pseudomonas monteilii TaxID=76759 RepID=UPI000761EEB6|nr:hypothetical protein [Pseudomonas monteilii]
MIKFFSSLIDRQKVRHALKGIEERMQKDGLVLVGVPKGAGNYEDGLTIATIAAVNNFGSADGHIPARPFLAPAVENGAPEYRRLVEVMLPKVMSGEVEMQTLLAQMGQLAEGHVKQQITELRTPPNAQSTIDKKGSDNPLIDTGALRQSIRYVLDDGAEPIEEGI